MMTIHLQLVVIKCDQALFKRAVFTVLDVAQKDLPCSSAQNDREDELLQLVGMMKALALEEAPADEQDEEDGATQDVQSGSRNVQHHYVTERKRRRVHHTPSRYQGHPINSRFTYRVSQKIMSTRSSHTVRRSQSNASQSSGGYVTTTQSSGGYSTTRSAPSRTWGAMNSTPARTQQSHHYRRKWRQPASYSTQQTSNQAPRPNICMRNATAWLEQAKADFNAAGTLLGQLAPPLATTDSQNTMSEAEHATTPASTKQVPAREASSQQKCKFPALVCFLCHDTVEKCMKGIHYAFCGLNQMLVDCNNLMMLNDSLHSSPYCPNNEKLMSCLKECLMTVTRHENKSRFPNYQNPPCAPATVYDTDDALDAYRATEKLLHQLQCEEKFCETLQDLYRLPPLRFRSSLKLMTANKDYPDNWDPMDAGEQVKKIPLDPLENNEEYERVADLFLLTLHDAQILKIERVQNKLIWTKYLEQGGYMKSLETPLREELLFHGTRKNNPKLIYKGEVGFDMRHSAEGMWGKGNYFAVNSSYSHDYSFQSGGLHVMFAAYVLTGNSFICNPDKSLRKPPTLALESCRSDATVQRHYDSVSGTTGGTRVYITYDNNRAYPAYIITYRM